MKHPERLADHCRPVWSWLHSSRSLLVVLSVTCAACSEDGPTTDPSSAGDAEGGDDSELPATGEEPVELEGTLAAHNQARDEEGLPPLEWDPALAAIASSWASQCIDADGNGLIDHNDGRSDDYPTYVGENIYGSSETASGPSAVASWMSEESSYDHSDCKCTAGACGHYSQVMWRDTRRLGCAKANCSGLTFGSAIICNYGPGGNVGGRCPF